MDPTRLAEIYAEARRHTAADVMTREVICVEEKEHVGHAAWLMAQRGLKHVPVLSDGALAGTITRADLIRMLAREGS